MGGNVTESHTVAHMAADMAHYTMGRLLPEGGWSVTPRAGRLVLRLHRAGKVSTYTLEATLDSPVITRWCTEAVGEFG
jgi:hypothetical protein